MKNSTKLILLLLVGLLFFLPYQQVRKNASREIRQELDVVLAEKKVLIDGKRELAELIKQYSDRTDVAAFVEQMDRYARQTGISDYELSTGSTGSGGRTGRGSGRVSRIGLDVSKMRVALSGGYRNIAEYLRLVQAINSPKKITALEMSPGEGVMKLTMNIELYSYREENES